MANFPIDLIKKFYYKEKLSTIEIAKKLKVTPWIVQKFMIRNGLPRRTFEEANALVFSRKPITLSLKKKLSPKEKQLKIAGIMLYWAEGNKETKTNFTIDFSNSDPEMIKVFLKFLRKICGVDENRLRVLIYCYANQNIEFLKKYWQKITKIPSKQFIKPYVRKDFLPQKSGKMKYGLAHIRYSDKKLFLKIQEWINEYLRINNIRVGTEVDKRGSL